MRKHVLSATKLHADDTSVQVLAPGNGKTKIGRLWTYVRDNPPCGDVTPPAVWFAYSPDRKSENPEEHLKSYKCALQADGYAGFNKLYEDGSIYEVACWAHARRKVPRGPYRARLAALYAIEAEIRAAPRRSERPFARPGQDP